jgi:hypothetical protein
MKQSSNKLRPQARSEGLVVKDLPEEVLVYDLARDKAHCLNHSAAAIWRRCDGRTTLSEITSAIRKETGSPIDEQFVLLALDQLGRDHLLEERVEWPAAIPRMTRREAVRRIGIGAVIAIPLVTTIIAPTPAQAATCKAPGVACSTSAQCCSGFCKGNGTCR